MNNENLIKQFYTSFAERNLNAMLECYHPDIVFQDPAFGRIEGKRACCMWKMLLSKKDSDLKVTFSTITANQSTGNAEWIAEYTLSDNGRKVKNVVKACFKFKEGKIIEHIDHFNLWKWSRQALGLPGYLLGWSPFMKKKIQHQLNKKLDKFIDRFIND